MSLNLRNQAPPFTGNPYKLILKFQDPQTYL